MIDITPLPDRGIRAVNGRPGAYDGVAAVRARAGSGPVAAVAGPDVSTGAVEPPAAESQPARLPDLCVTGDGDRSAGNRPNREEPHP